MKLEPKKGAIAYCSLNRLGLITSETPIDVIYNDGNTGISWVGIQLTDGQVEGIGGDKGKIINQKVGDPWMSKHPNVVCYLDDIDKIINFIKFPSDSLYEHLDEYDRIRDLFKDKE